MSLHELDNGSSSGLSAPNTYALWGDSNTGDGVVGTSNGDTGVYGRSNLAGSIGDDIVYGGYGVFGVNDQTVGIGVFGQGNGDNGFGIWGTSTSGQCHLNKKRVLLLIDYDECNRVVECF